jgi:hypothetical protein
MITHIFSVVPKMYVMPITRRTQSGIKSLKEVEAEITDYWESFIEKKQPKELTNQVLAIKSEEGILTFKKLFKGDCSHCGKQGQKGADCYGNKWQEECHDNHGNNRSNRDGHNANHSSGDKSKV